MQTSYKGLNVIRSFEGRALRAYQDSVGIWTIGYGSTNYDKNAVKRFGKIRKGLTITAQQAEELFVESIRTGYEPAVQKRLNPLLNCSQATFDAGVSFHYNTGKIGPATWPSALIAGNYALARTSILSWNKAGGQVLSGLTRRRNREWLMISKSDYGPEGSQGPIDLETKKQLPAPTFLKDTDIAVATPEATGSRVPGLLQLGDTGEAVAELNLDLVTLGRLPRLRAVSSTFDAETEKAVRAYQGAHPNLTVDGKVGPATRSALLRDINLLDGGGKTVQAVGVVGAVGGVLATAGLVALKTALVAAGVVGAVGLIYLVVKHWTELKTLWNTIRRKQVP